MEEAVVGQWCEGHGEGGQRRGEVARGADDPVEREEASRVRARLARREGREGASAAPAQR